MAASVDAKTSVKSTPSLAVAAGDVPRLNLGDAAVVERGELQHPLGLEQAGAGVRGTTSEAWLSMNLPLTSDSIAALTSGL